MAAGERDKAQEKQEADATRRATGDARSLAATMPRLILEARRVAATIIHGLHGRRRAGTGESFWQFRRFVSGEPAGNVDWRRSARDDHLYVREHEWEAAHTVWIWADRSPSMLFASPLVWETKLDRALVVAFALAEVLVEGGERVGLPGLMRASASRNIIEKMAEIIVHDPSERASLPPNFSPSPLSEVVMLSDLWSPIEDVRRTLGLLSATGAHGHVIQVVDPAEETFPYSGRIQFLEPEDGRSITAGRAEMWRADFEARVARHRAEIRAETDRLGWSFIIHRTDRPASELLLALHSRMGAGGAGAGMNRWQAVATGEVVRMIGGIPLGFAQPLILLGLISLPVLWWLLRLVPPRPRRIFFPPTRLLFDIAPKEETPSRTPWWLTLLRLTLAALVILAAAGPQWNPPLATAQASAPLALLVDDGWAAAATWDIRVRTAEDLIARAETDNRGVAIIPLSEIGRDISLETPGAARVRLRSLKPKPHTIERVDALPAIGRFVAATPSIEVLWLSDGVDVVHGKEFVDALAKTLEKQTVTVVEGGVTPAHALVAADNAAGALTVKVLRARTNGGENGIVRALDPKGLPLGEAPFAFKGSDRETEATFDLPVEIRNDIARLEVAAERSSGAVQLLDKRWRRRTVGVITGSGADNAQPLLASTFYLARALNPFADVRLADRGSPAEAVKTFLDQSLPMLILADVGNVPGEARERLGKWIDEGGVLVRFAGPRLAAGDDDLVPVKLRRGGRTLGGSLSWEQPQQLSGFSRDSPFNGMTVPNDVTVTRQVLAEPDSGLTERTWATLGDGTPLVTASKRGKGLIVLFHVSADTRWSNLPLSGSFVEMLKRIVSVAGTSGSEPDARGAREAIPPNRVLDGFGAFGPAPSTTRPVPANYNARATADHPPGFYGPPEGLVAVNTLHPADRLNPIDYRPLNARMEAYRLGEPKDLRGALFLAALALLVIDALVVFWLAGGIHKLQPRRRAVARALVLGLIGAGLLLPHDASAQAPRPTPAPSATATPNPVADDFAVKATLDTRLAYIVTGNAEVDNISKVGLQGLTLFLAQRTALEAGEPIGLDPARDELAFFPLIYWPIVPGAAKPSPDTLARIDAYMKQGGTVLFDTRDAVLALPGPGGEQRSPGMLALREILTGLDIPELEPLPRDHVLTKTFFLLKDFPGRFASGQLWVEATAPPSDDEQTTRPARAGDGVSSILITSNDFAGAWAQRIDGMPDLPLFPGEPRQREFAFRAGVNIVMYTLTGNYKADQVHIPALLERLGQ